MSSNLYGQFDCSMPRDPRMRRAGPLARLVYFEAALYCRENLTDGFIDEANLADFAPDVRSKRRYIERLVDVGALERVVNVRERDTNGIERALNGWRIPLNVWRRWNPTRAEVEAKRAAEAERKAAYREKRQAVPDMSQRDSNGTDEAVPTGQRVAVTLPRGQPKPKPEPKPEIGISSTDGFKKDAPPPVENHRIEAALKHIVEQRINGRAQGKNPAYRRTVTNDVTNTHRAELERFAKLAPNAPADVLAAFAQGDTHSLRYYTEDEP